MVLQKSIDRTGKVGSIQEYTIIGRWRVDDARMKFCVCCK
jgi:hypothetical protein